MSERPNLSRRHSDLPRLSTTSEPVIRDVKDLRNSPGFLLRERSHRSFDVAEDKPRHQPSGSSLREEWELVSDMRHHKAVERHRLRREEDVVSRHTTFFPKRSVLRSVTHELQISGI